MYESNQERNRGGEGDLSCFPPNFIIDSTAAQQRPNTSVRLWRDYICGALYCTWAELVEIGIPIVFVLLYGLIISLGILLENRIL